MVVTPLRPGRAPFGVPRGHPAAIEQPPDDDCGNSEQKGETQYGRQARQHGLTAVLRCVQRRPRRHALRAGPDGGGGAGRRGSAAAAPVVPGRLAVPAWAGSPAGAARQAGPAERVGHRAVAGRLVAPVIPAPVDLALVTLALASPALTIAPGAAFVTATAPGAAFVTVTAPGAAFFTATTPGAAFVMAGAAAPAAVLVSTTLRAARPVGRSRPRGPGRRALAARGRRATARSAG